MKIDTYTKIVLTIIALALIINIIMPITSGGGGKFSHLQVYGMVEFFDTTTGKIWHYDQRSGEYQFSTQLIELGKNMVRY
jgi:hypothetical protein